MFIGSRKAETPAVWSLVNNSTVKLSTLAIDSILQDLTTAQLANVKGVVVEAVPRAGTAVLNADDHLVYRMGRHCDGRVILFSIAKEKGEDGHDRVIGHTSRGNAASNRLVSSAPSATMSSPARLMMSSAASSNAAIDGSDPTESGAPGVAGVTSVACFQLTSARGR